MTRCIYLSFKLLLLGGLFVPVSIIAAPTALFTPRHDDSTNITAIATPTISEAAPATGSTGIPNFKTQNALDAQKLNTQFLTLEATDSCQDGAIACVNSSFAQCVGGKWAVTPCSGGTACVALPLVNKAGTSLTCDSKEDAARRFVDAGVTGGITGGNQASSDSSTPRGAEPTGDLECDGQEQAASATVQSASAKITSSSPPAPSDNNMSTASASASVTSTRTGAPTRAAAATTIFLNRRQITLTPASAATTLSSVSAILPTPSSVISLSGIASASVSALVPSVFTLPTSAGSPSIPAVGVTTVTVVSTVTVTCHDVFTPVPTPFAVSSISLNFPGSSSINTSPPIFTSTPISVASGTLVGSVSATLSASSSLQSGFVASFPSTVSASSFPTTASTTSTPVGGGFSFSTAPVVTATPNSGVNNVGAVGGYDISKLLTATV